MSRLIPISDCVETSQTWNPATSVPEKEFRYIDLSSVDREQKQIAVTEVIRCGSAPSRARQLVRSGDVLVSTVRPNLNGVAMVPKELDGATASTGFTVLRAKQARIDRSYLFHWVKNACFVDDMVRKATGASYPAVSDRIVRESLIPLPALPEQRRIAAILDKADALRAKRRDAIAKLDQLLQSVFLEMFGDPVTNSKGIDQIQMGDLTLIKTGKLDANASSEDGEYPFFTCARESLRISSFSYDCECVLVAGNGDLNVKIYSGKFDAYQRTYIVESKDKNKLTTRYLYHFLDSYLGELRKQAIGGIIKYIKIGNLTDAMIPLPSLPEQQKFAAIATKIETQKQAMQHSANQLDALFATLQHRAFTGTL